MTMTNTTPTPGATTYADHAHTYHRAGRTDLIARLTTNTKREAA